jgi:hypothetical protein
LTAQPTTFNQEVDMRIKHVSSIAGLIIVEPMPAQQTPGKLAPGSTTPGMLPGKYIHHAIRSSSQSLFRTKPRPVIVRPLDHTIASPGQLLYFRDPPGYPSPMSSRIIFTADLTPFLTTNYLFAEVVQPS